MSDSVVWQKVSRVGFSKDAVAGVKIGIGTGKVFNFFCKKEKKEPKRSLEKASRENCKSKPSSRSILAGAESMLVVMLVGWLSIWSATWLVGW